MRLKLSSTDLYSLFCELCCKRGLRDCVAETNGQPDDFEFSNARGDVSQGGRHVQALQLTLVRHECINFCLDIYCSFMLYLHEVVTHHQCIDCQETVDQPILVLYTSSES